MDVKEWFSTWFDSPYYHILYAQRDEAEAAAFIRSLQQKLKLKKETRVLDVACGKGRHAITLHNFGLDVKAFDLSPSNIEQAQEFASEGLEFFVHDLRKALPDHLKFEVIFNFFTSFGYFDTPQENQQAFHVLSDGLLPEGVLVMDFFNPSYVLSHLIEKESLVRGGISFHIKRWASEGYLFKSIDFEDQGQQYHFEERVELISKNDFIAYAAQAGLHLVDLLGDYKLGSFDEKNSARMIFIWVKK
ncbi:class I SAM-dependent methyltransferase [Aquirufa rosea]|uniref:Class I SAM-dependent methyltransferase n=1 Tax=Aquirufa rosea TaxID=2509241 RepID=A0A4Q1BYH4_9BACT|nr:class I SAM-dependent methyltransferase [Aquirufa rosea]RXK48160.1 class I SAM-dependent methyltransferase [Aquirufa rosea]